MIKLKPSVEKLQAYFVNDIPYRVKLDANEGSNYLLKDGFKIEEFKPNLYPDSDSKFLREKMADYYGCKSDNIMVGNGSSELINTVINAYCDKGDKVISFVPSFSMYQTYCDLCGAEYVGIETEGDFSQNIDKLINEQDNLDNLDTVSGATISSTAVKKAFINTLNDYNNDGYKNFNGSNKPEEDKDNTKPDNTDFIINSKVQIDGKVVYNVNQKSFGGFMNLEITVENDIVTAITIISFNDTCVSSAKTNEHYNCPRYMLDGYVNEVIANNNTDTVSGATISSSAIKNSVANVLNDYRGIANEG